MVPPGQIARKQPPPHKMKDVIDYAKKRPDDRFTIIRQGVQVQCLLMIIDDIFDLACSTLSTSSQNIFAHSAFKWTLNPDR